MNFRTRISRKIKILTCIAISCDEEEVRDGSRFPAATS